MDEHAIPEDVIDGLMEVREIGAINMFDYRGAVRMLEELCWYDAADWLRESKDRYLDALNEMGKRLP